jgi:hypothetical protein
LRHREIEFDVEEGPPSSWHWIIYPGAALPEVIGETKFQSWEAAVNACVSVHLVNEGRPARFATDVIAMLQDLADKGFLSEARERTS